MLCFLITLQRYDIISIYAKQLTLIKFFLYFYTFSLTHTYARTLYKTKGTDGQTDTSTKQKAYICVLSLVLWVSSGSLPVQNEQPKRTNTKRKISL